MPGIEKMSPNNSLKKGHLPVSRINTIMKSSSDVETVGKMASLMMCKATEIFIRALAEEAYAVSQNARKLDYKHLTQVVHSDDRYNFLRDIMPKKITYAEYKRVMARKQRQGDSAEKNGTDTSSASSSDEDENSDSDDSDGSRASA